MFDPISAPTIISIVCSAYLLSLCCLMGFTTGAWSIVAYLEHQDNHLPKWFS